MIRCLSDGGVLDGFGGVEMIKVFLVEDEFTIRESIKKTVHWESEGFELVGEAGDGELAYPMILASRPDILLTDIRMPFMDGLELSKLVKKELPEIKILILSGYDDFSYAQDAIRIGVEDYLLKPLTADTLLKKLHEVASSIRAKQSEQETLLYYQRELEEARELEKQKFLKDMLDGRISVMDVVNRGRGLGIDMTGVCYAALLLEIRCREQEEALESYSAVREEIFEKIQQQYATNEQIYIYVQSGNTLCFLLKAESQETLAALEKGCVQEMEALLGAYPDMLYYMSIGRPVERVRDLHKSYESANKKFAMRYMWEESHIFSYKDPDDMEIQMQQEASIDYRKMDITKMSQKYLSNYLRNGSLAEVEDFVEDYFASMGNEAVASYMLRQYVVMGAIFCMLSFLESLAISKEEIYDSFGDMQEGMKHIGTQEETKAYITELLVQSLTIRNNVSSKRYISLINDAIAYMQENFDKEDMSLQMVASSVNVSPSHFSAVFKQETGQNFVDYLTDIRIAKAKELLTCTSMRTSDIGFAVGYRDPHYFSYKFKKAQGMSPKEYRQQQKTGDRKADTV